MAEHDWAEKKAEQIASGAVYKYFPLDEIAKALREVRVTALEEAAVFVETHLIGCRGYAVKAIPGNYEKRGLLADAIRTLKEKDGG